MIRRNGERYLLEGPVIMANVEAVLAEGRSQFTDGVVTVDLSGVTEVDSSAVSLLLEWLRAAAGDNRRIEYRGLPDNLRSLINLYGVHELIPAASRPGN
ncbi:MAG: STAS domain-containing protein [Betaproteobacteria bacterium]|nr:STAS domain-containing protein [Betaproteobacteria bacterium]